jgi:hypothetical protein
MQRWDIHIRTLRSQKHRNCRLQSHFNKYGECDLQFNILEHCDKNALLNREQYYLDKLKPSFNICRKAGSPLGAKWSEESKLKFSQRQKGRKLSEEHKRKIGLKSKGHKLTNEAKKKIGESSHLRVCSEETRRKISKNRKGKGCWMRGRHHSNETKKKLHDANIGKKQSKETIEKRTEKLRGKRWTEEMKVRARKPKTPQHRENMKRAWVLRKLIKNELCEHWDVV